MLAKHTFKNNGNRLEYYLWDDIAEGRTIREVIEVEHIYKGQRQGRRSRKKLFKDANGVYIVWNKTKVYLNDFDYDPIDTLVARINKGVADKNRWSVFEEEMLATFLKETDKVGIIYDAPVIDTIVPIIGVAMYSDRTTPTLCVLSEKEYKKSNWDYKITLLPENEQVRKSVIANTLYTSDMWSMIMAGIIKVVNLDKYKAEREAFKERYRKATKRERNLMSMDSKYQIYFTV